MIKQFIKIQILVATIALLALMAVNSADAAGLIKDDVKSKINENAQNVGGTAGYEESTNALSALYIIQTVISVFLSVIGVLLLSYVVFAGYNWMTAQGEEEKVTRAKDTIKRAIIGVIIIIAAYAISTFVISRMEAGVLKGSSGGVGTSAL